MVDLLLYHHNLCSKFHLILETSSGIREYNARLKKQPLKPIVIATATGIHIFAALVISNIQRIKVAIPQIAFIVIRIFLRSCLSKKVQAKGEI